MKLREFLDYVDAIRKSTERNPDLLDATVIYSIDDEGNDYRPVNYPPSFGEWDDGDFMPDGSPEAICIN